MDDEDIFDNESEECIDMSDEFAEVMGEHQAAKHEKLQGKNNKVLTSFLGKGARSVQVAVIPGYYGSLLIWALKRVIEEAGWEIIKTLGYHTSQPTFVDVQTDYQKSENLLQDGQILLKKGDLRLIVTISCAGVMSNSVLVEGNKADEKAVRDFTEAIKKYASEHNFYRGKRIEFGGMLVFLDVEPRLWDSIVLNEEIKAEICANTVDFLRKCPQLERYGIPPRRGIVLAGEPGTGKTIVCRALMSQAENISCITANAYLLTEPFYISQLYELAADLSPSIVFIEDVDFIGQDRLMQGFHVGAPLLALLNEMDGIEKHKQIVTVATTNGLERLDKALCERPSRFDRVIKLNRPTVTEREQIVARLCARIPLADEVQDYIARRTDGFTPAQLQEVVFGMAIEYGDAEGTNLGKINPAATDRIIGRINGRKSCRLGFKSFEVWENSVAFSVGSQNKTSEGKD